MSVRSNLANEFLAMAIDDLREAGTELTLQTQHQVLSDWCDVYEDVPPRNRAELAVQDALVLARDCVIQRIHEKAQMTV